MKVAKTFLERAFELAKSGQCASFKDLRMTLKAERYLASEIDQLKGLSLRRQLLDLMAKHPRAGKL